MKRIFSVFEAKARLSELIRIVRSENEVIITDRSKPVVRMVPIKEKGVRTLSDRMMGLERQGLIASPKPDKVELEQHPLPVGVLAKFLRDRD